MDQDERVMAAALRDWERFRSPRDFLRTVLPIIRTPEDVASILSRLPPPPSRARAWVIRELRERYGPHLDLSEDNWGLAAGSYLDEQARLRRHAAYVAHAVRVAIPAIRSWLSTHPEGEDGAGVK